MPIRPFHREDIEPMTEILRATGMFRPDEIEVAVELMEIVVNEPHQQDYMMYTSITEDGTVRGYYCVGPTPMTQGAFDLYWIAVHPSHQGKGIGREMMKHCEDLVRSQQGRLILAETSSQEKYAATNAFYQRAGFTASARVNDYYAPGDDLIIYTRYL
ncbi:MAG TPA: GNAT family N-acetyltransferase [Bacteroidota bacterium]|nr:GNAT family N-acetyltransferase [Bacteroidota bacterium]